MENITPSGLKKQSGDLPTKELSIFVKSKLIPFFFQLLGQGFPVNVPANCSIRDLIVGCLGIPDDYLEERIQTLFLNGNVVDDLNSCNIKEGSALALSGAMPGLAGAVLRRGGFYASFRRTISLDDSQSRIDKDYHWIILKLFNMIVKELGPGFLEKGIWVEGKLLQKFLMRHAEELRMHGTSGDMNGQPADMDNLLQFDWKTHLVFLRVTPESAA